jgi:protein HOOK3
MSIARLRWLLIRDCTSKSKLQISRLESELSQILEGDEVSADNIMLQHMLEDATKARDKLEQDFLKSHTERLVLEAQLLAIGGGSSVEG